MAEGGEKLGFCGGVEGLGEGEDGDGAEGLCGRGGRRGGHCEEDGGWSRKCVSMWECCARLVYRGGEEMRPVEYKYEDVGVMMVDGILERGNGVSISC